MQENVGKSSNFRPAIVKKYFFPAIADLRRLLQTLKVAIAEWRLEKKIAFLEKKNYLCEIKIKKWVE